MGIVNKQLVYLFFTDQIHDMAYLTRNLSLTIEFKSLFI